MIITRIRVGNVIIGEREPCYVIAEAGVNHNGDLTLAKKLIKAAKESGANAVKFQTWITEETITSEVLRPEYQREDGSNDDQQYTMIEELELSAEDFTKLAKYAESVGIDFLSTPEGKTCINLLCDIGVPAFKVGSPDIVNHPDLCEIAKKGKPILLSTGMATLDEIRDAIQVIKSAGNNDIILLHCTSCYPTPYSSVNLRAMHTLRDTFQMPVGYSDHTEGTFVPALAVAMGAVALEKHLTIDKHLPGPDHRASVEPNEFRDIVNSIRLAEKCLGSPKKEPTTGEKEMRKLARKYLVANAFIPEGRIISEGDIGVKRVNNGIHLPTFTNLQKFLGKRADKEYQQNEPL